MPTNTLQEIQKKIRQYSNKDQAKQNAYFFKIGKGQYAEGDVFIGLTNPEIREIAKTFFNKISLKDTIKLLSSKIHEERLLALIILVNKFKSHNKKTKEEIFNLYLKNIKYINNWDLVDSSSREIIGEFIKEKYSLKSKNCSGVKFLLNLASDKNIFAKNSKEKLWEKRIAIVSTFAFMFKPYKNNYIPKIVFEIVSKILSEKDKLNNHDLIQKATGWMLREYGKRVNEKDLKDFLLNNFKEIKSRRTLLRYAIERFNEVERKAWLSKLA